MSGPFRSGFDTGCLIGLGLIGILILLGRCVPVTGQ